MHDLIGAAATWLNALASPVVGEGRVLYSTGRSGADPYFTVEVASSYGGLRSAPDIRVYDWPDLDIAQAEVEATITEWENSL